MIPFADVRAAQRPILSEIQGAIADIFESGRFVQGRWVAQFEANFANYLGVEHAVAVSSGTEALVLALRALGVGPGDEVIVPAFTFFATAEAVCLAGATPVLVDVDPRTWQIDADAVAAAVGERTVGVVPVHLFGAPADLLPLLEVAVQCGLWVLEDAAQAHGATYFDKSVGGFGNAGCFSFYPGKNLGTCGEGGAVTTNDAGLAAELRLLRDHGARDKYEHVRVGTNGRMSEIEAAVLALKLPALSALNASRREVARWYTSELAATPVRVPAVVEGGDSVHHLMAVEVPQRDALRDYLAEREIQTGLHYPTPLHRQPALEGRVRCVGSLEAAAHAAAHTLSLPLYPGLERDSVRRVARTVRAFCGRGAVATLP